jgi:DNA-directed RNA polymerase specialized sigma24 family protein
VDVLRAGRGPYGRRWHRAIAVANAPRRAALLCKTCAQTNQNRCPHPSNRTGGPHRSAERALLLEALYEIDSLLEGLPVVVKRAFLLAQLDGSSHAEIAAQLKISIATVKRYLVRAGAQCFFALNSA